VIAAIVAAAAVTTWNRLQPAPKIGSLGVLPFRDLTNSPDGQHFADGIAETIASRLTQSNAIRVAPLLDGSAKGTLKEIAARRGADRLLRGAVQRSGDRVR